MLKRFLIGIIFIFTLSLASSVKAKTENMTIEGDHGKLAAVLQTPDGVESYPLVIILHGFTANKENLLLLRIADELQVKGIASLRFDFNGHGESEGELQDMTVLNEIEDVKKVYEYALSLPNIDSVSLVGHSQGGVVAGMVAGELGADKIKSLVLLAPAAVLRDNALKGDLYGFEYDVNNLPETIYFFSHKIGRAYLETSQNLPIYETSMKYIGPVYIVHGTADELVPYSYAVRYEEIYQNGKLELLESFDHNFNQDLNKVVDLVTDFFANTLKR